MSSIERLAALVWAEITASGLRQAEIAAEVGITEKHLSRFVRGHDGMSLELIDRILAIVGRELVLSTRVAGVKA